MKVENGSVLSLTPSDPGTRLKLTVADKEVYYFPIVAWAVVVDHMPDDDMEGHDTSVEPIILSEGRFPLTMTRFTEDLHDRNNCVLEIILPWD